MFGEETNTLQEALSFARLRELPKKYDPGLGLTWILAVAYVRKKNLMRSYAIVEQRADGLIQYKKTFGSVSQLDSLLAIYPYMYVDGEALAKATRANRRTLSIIYPGYRDDIIDSDDERFKVYQLQYAMDMQKLDMDKEHPRFGKSVVDEAEEKAHPVEEVLKDNEVVATVEDEGECVIEVEDASTAFRSKRTSKAKREG